jgi:hypothetical protein
MDNGSVVCDGTVCTMLSLPRVSSHGSAIAKAQHSMYVPRVVHYPSLIDGVLLVLARIQSVPTKALASTKVTDSFSLHLEYFHRLRSDHVKCIKCLSDEWKWFHP